MASIAPKRRKPWKWLFWLVVVPVALFAGYTWVVLNWSYSEGERAGYVQKLSKRGWLCKTWEGELALVTMPGTVAEKFFFTVPDPAVAQRINASIGQRVTLDYQQHVGIPSSCFAETDYFVTDVRVVDEPTLLPGSARPAPEVPATPPAAQSPALPVVPETPPAVAPDPAGNPQPGETPK